MVLIFRNSTLKSKRMRIKKKITMFSFDWHNLVEISYLLITKPLSFFVPQIYAHNWGSTLNFMQQFDIRRWTHVLLKSKSFKFTNSRLIAQLPLGSFANTTWFAHKKKKNYHNFRFNLHSLQLISSTFELIRFSLN